MKTNKIEKVALCARRLATCFVGAAALIMATAAWGAFKYETTLTVGGYAGDDSLADFPLLVRISTARISGFSYDKCQADGKDLQFTSADGATTYPHEIDEWNSGGESLVWVKVPLAKSMKIVMKFGDSSLASSTEDAASVWSAYTGVWHMNETAGEGTTSFTAYDSTANKLDLTANGSSYISRMISFTGRVGRGRQNDTVMSWGSCNRLVNSSTDTFNALGDSFVASGWFYFHTRSNSHYLMGRKGNRGSTDGGWLIDTSDSGARIHGSTTSMDFANSSIFNAGGWTYLTVVYNGDTAKIYADGSLKTTGTLKSRAASCAKYFSIGCNQDGGTACLAGCYDEVRMQDFTDAEPTASRISAEYKNMTTSDYVTFSAVEELAAANTLSVSADADYAEFAFSPAIGTSTLTAGEVTCTATAGEKSVATGTKARISGWTLTHIAPSGAKTTTDGEGTSCTFTHEAGGGAAIVWHFARTHKATVDSNDAEKGAVTGDGWYDEGVTATVTANLKGDYYFSGWTGDVPSGDEKKTTLSITMDAPKTLRANFSDKPYYTLAVASADETKGSVSGGGSIQLGNEAMLVAAPKDGYRFAGWTGTLPTGCTAQNAGLNFEVAGDVSLTATFAELVTYTFTNVVKNSDNKYYWSEAKNWIDITGDGTGDIPPNDGTARVKIAFSSDVEIMLDNGPTKVYGLYFAGKGQVKGANWNYRYFVIGAGGVDGDAGAKMPDFSTKGCELTSSQTWHLKSNGIASKEVRTASEIVLTISGPYTTSLEFTGFTGKLKTNVGMAFPPGARAMEVFNYPGEDGVSPSITMNESIYYYAYAADGGTISTPVTMDITNNVPVTIAIGNSPKAFSWIYDFAGAWNGHVADDGSSRMSFSSGYPTILSDVGRVVFSGPTSGLTNMWVKTSNTMIELSGPNAAFADGSCSFQISAGGARGWLGGLLLGDGIALHGELYMNPYREWQTGGLSDAQIAVKGSGRVDLHGKIINTNETTYSSGGYASYFGSSAGELQFYAPEGATINVHNEIVGAKVLPVRILGDGVVTFKHTNAQMVKAPVVQSGTLQIEAQDATGTGTISLGVSCPTNCTIAAMAPMETSYVGTMGTGDTGTYSGLIKSMFDGYQPVSGDTVLLNFHVENLGKVGLYHLSTETQFEKLPTAKANTRVTVQNGTHFAGCSYYSVNGDKIWNKESAKAEPDCALLGAKGVTITNDIVVADNKSAGSRTLGVADATTVTFSGNVILSNSVTFAAAAGGKIVFTGAMTDAAGTKQPVTVKGLGTVKLTEIEWTGRSLDLSSLDAATLEASGLRRVVILRAKGVGKATVTKPADLGKWRLSVRDNFIGVSKGGMAVVVR